MCRSETNQSAWSGCFQESGLTTQATTKNQLLNYGYDAAGNLTSVPSVASYMYDAENHLISTAGYTYSYDGDGKRVMKSSGGSGTLYWYGLNSEPLFETSLAGGGNFAYYYFDGRITHRRQGAHFFTPDLYVHDALGNTNLVSTTFPDGWDYSDYYPFGGERVHKSLVGNHYKFTGKERDPESGLDNFGARYFTSNLGRFMSPDPGNVGAYPDTPQSWNAYSYVLNNPLNLIDPDGLWCAYLNDGGTAIEGRGIDTSSNSGECNQNGGYWIEGDFGAASLNTRIDTDNGTVTGVGYDANGNPELSVAGAMGSNQWGAWTQTYNPGGLNWAQADVPSIIFRQYWRNEASRQEGLQFYQQNPLFFKLAPLGGAVSGLDPELCGSTEGTQSAPTDSTKQTEGQKSAQVYEYGPDGRAIPLTYKNNKPVAPNPKGAKAADLAQTPGNVAAWLAGASQCLAASSQK